MICRTLLRWLLPVLTLAGAPAQAQRVDSRPLSEQDSFRIGNAGLTLCIAQLAPSDRARADMFDRAYAIVCRDAATSVGQVFALRARRGDPAGRLTDLRAGRVRCIATSEIGIEDVGVTELLDCRLVDTDVAYRVYVHRTSDTVYIAEGLAGYDDALRLGLRSVVANRIIDGEVSIAVTGAGDPAAFARVQAGALDRLRALGEAYRRNNTGSFAESAEYFSVLADDQDEAARRGEAQVNEALQRSNLGHFVEADALFERALPLASTSPVAARRYRNYRAMHLLNQGFEVEALGELDRSLPDAAPSSGLRDGVIDSATAARLSAEAPGAQRLAGLDGLTEQDKARVLDGQARQVRAAVLRRQGNLAEAEVALVRALEELVAIRGGRIAATIWLRAQVLGDLAGIAEERGNRAEAEARHRSAVALLEGSYPGSGALLSARGRLAAFLLRVDRAQDAIGLYREIVAASAQEGSLAPSYGRVIAPYLDLLAQRGEDPAAIAELFIAAQALARPGVAHTQAVLARSLSERSDEAARLFRQSLDLTRSIERERVELARLESSGQAPDRAAELRQQLDRMRQDQVETQARLGAFPRYRVVARSALTLTELQTLLQPGEAYYKLAEVNDALYAIFVTQTSARAFRLPVSPSDLSLRVDRLRSTISQTVRGRQVTTPFDVGLAHQLFNDLFTPVLGELSTVTHLIFEPDAAMMRLPPNLLVMTERSVAHYRARVATSARNAFDFRGVRWLGRDRDVSTSVSPRAFRDVRQAAPSRARAPYIGFGQNSPPPPTALAAAGLGGGACVWPATAWARPISPAELFAARDRLGVEVGGGSEVVTGAAFSDSAIRARADLARFRILHFATHSVVSPRPDCPPRPALLTSFGVGDSDGLLSFREIFELNLDADLVVLSACDTATGGSAAAAGEAGIAAGGDFTLDGLVRAFVGAGARLVVASHWPVPDDYSATERLVGGMFAAPSGTGVAAALRMSQRSLMDSADTSHPFYWAGFAVIGDGIVPVIRPAGAAASAGR